MHLAVLEPVDYLGAGFLEQLRPLDVVALVEARAQLEKREDLLAVLGGADKRVGKAALKAVTQGDIPFVMAYNMFLSLLTVIGTLFSDIMYAVVDPRVKITD